VSFRRNNQIYWTRNQMTLAKGELVLAADSTPGSELQVRARCGNKLS
jgi:hypothetical protein